MPEVLKREQGQHYSTGAVVYAGNSQYTCRLLKISPTGTRLLAPCGLPRGTFIRINLTLPGVARVLDVDGVVAQAGREQGHIMLSVQFLNASQEFTITLATFLKWLGERRQSMAREGKKGAAEVPRSSAEAELERTTTGPHFPRVSTAELRKSLIARAGKKAMSREQRQRLREEVEARWARHEHATRERKKLNELYRSALRELSAGSKTR